MGWVLILMLMAIFLVARESFTRQSSGSSLVRDIICLFGKRLGIRWWEPLSCATQLLLQLVNLTLHVSFILCMGDMALPSWLTLASMCCLHTSFMISPLLKVYDWIITLRTPWFRLVQINIILMWADHRLVRTWLFHFQHLTEISFWPDQALPTDGANCKDQFWLGPLNRIRFWPNKPKQQICRAWEKELAWF